MQKFFSPSWVDVTCKPIRHFYKKTLDWRRENLFFIEGKWKREGQRKSGEMRGRGSFRDNSILPQTFYMLQTFCKENSEWEKLERKKKERKTFREEDERNKFYNECSSKSFVELYIIIVFLLFFFTGHHGGGAVNLAPWLQLKEEWTRNIKKVTWNQNEHAKGLGMGENGIIFIVVFRKRLKGMFFKLNWPTCVIIYHWKIIVSNLSSLVCFVYFSFFLFLSFITIYNFFFIPSLYRSDACLSGSASKCLLLLSTSIDISSMDFAF